MYKVLIIDDEEIVRQGLKRFVDWESLGFEVVGDLGSAIEAVDFVEIEEVDVIVTDIKMPDMDGLTFIEQIKEKDFNIKTVILSAYGEFEYAKKALKLGAYDFLTKPVDFIELKKILKDIKVMLDEELKENSKKKEYILLAKERLLNNLAKGFYTNQTDYEIKFSKIGISLEQNEFRFLRLYISGSLNSSIDDKHNNGLASMKQELYEFMQEDLLTIGRCYVFNNDMNELTALIYSDMNEDDINVCLESLQQHIADIFHLITHIGVGSVYKDLTDASTAYEEAGRALEYRIFKKSSSVLFYNDICKFFEARSIVNDEMERDILSYLGQADEKGLAQYIDNLFSNIFERSNVNINMVYDSFIAIILIINKYLGSMDETLFTDDNYYSTIRAFLEQESLEEMKAYMGVYINNSISSIKAIKETTAGRIVENAKNYISVHYAEEITLNKLSEILYVHPIYISKQFKEKTGENFIDYLTKIRVEKSKALLADFSLKIYEISEMVGYESSKYFSKVFKEMVGLTPKEYRNTIVL